MTPAREMSLPDAFYALVLDEVRRQPNLQGELRGSELGGVVLGAFGRGLEWVCAQFERGWTGLPKAVITGPGFDVVRSLLPPPASLFRPVSEVLSLFLGSNYDALCRSALLHLFWFVEWMMGLPNGWPALCRSALLHLFWGQLGAAEKKVNVAKLHHDDRAFAHHVYGLLRGLEDNREGARFELSLALAREGFEGARDRIRRALRLVE